MENQIKKYNCAGTGLLALDLVVQGKSDLYSKSYAGGSCGNVLTILSYFKMNSFPIARLGVNNISELILEDLLNWGVNNTFIEREHSGSSPIIIHRILNIDTNKPHHRFEFRNPKNGKWLPSYKPVLAKKVEEISQKLPQLDVFYFDRISRSSLDLAKYAKSRGAMIFFEPSSNKDKKFEEARAIADIIKYSGDRIKNYREEYANNQSVLEIETNGEKGLYYRFKNDDWKFLNSYYLNNAVDNAGAGDWTSAAIIEKLVTQKISELSESKIVDALKFGQALATLNCQFFGARGLMYNLERSVIDEIIKLIMANNTSSSKIEKLIQSTSFKFPIKSLRIQEFLNTA